MENDLLQECKLQLEYLNQKFGETGTTNSLLSRIETALQHSDSKNNSCSHEFVSREYISQSYGTCMGCGKVVID